MLQVRNMSIKSNSSNRFLIKDFSLDVSNGSKVAIIGEEGNGKSTLLKALAGDHSIEKYCSVGGQVVNTGVSGYLPQFIDNYWDDKSVSDFLLCDHPGDVQDYNLYALYASKYELIDKLGLPSEIYFSDQIMSTLSGGEHIKIQLLKILSKEPTMLLLDEPTNDLDIGTVEFLQDFLNKIDIPVIFVSHDEELIENVANMIVHIEQLRRKTEPRVTVYKGKYSDYIEERANSFAKQNQMATFENAQLVEAKRRIREMKSQAASNTAYSTARIRQIKSIERKLEKRQENLTQYAETEEAISLIIRDNKKLPDRKVVIDFNGPLYIGDRLLQDNIQFSVIGNQRLAIMGENGAGKTTLLRVIYDEIKPRSDLKVGYMPQNYEDLLDKEQSAAEYLQGTNKKFTQSEVMNSLGCLRFTHDEMIAKIKDLSGGQKAKLLIAGFILNGCNVLLLDEPTRNLSPLSLPVLEEIINRFGGCVICVSHDRKWIESTCDSILYLKKNENEVDVQK